MSFLEQTTERKSFLPDNYKLPDRSKQFMKLAEGENSIRILSEPLLGWIVFTEEKKPVRRQFSLGEFTHDEMVEMKAKKNEKGEFEGNKHFWMVLVWDYYEKAPRLLEITQLTIQKKLAMLLDNSKWGDIRDYDINIIREGTGKNDTSFEVIPDPKTELHSEVKQCLKELEEGGNFKIDAIWEGKYPFEIYNW